MIGATAGDDVLPGWEGVVAAELDGRREAAADPPHDVGLYDRTAGLYAFLREHVFRDDTDRIVATVWPFGAPRAGTTLLELGCGPGVYARRLARRFPGLRCVGVDRSERLVALARDRATRERLADCWFGCGDARSLPWPDASVDVVLASRLLTVVDAPRVLAEAHRVLRPGGRCFVAEPTSWLRLALPSLGLRLADALRRSWTRGHRLGGAEPSAWSGDGLPHDDPSDDMTPLPPTGRGPVALEPLLRARPWAATRVWSADGYVYALCERGAD